VNTSFNVAAPIAQSPLQALDTLRRANGGRRFQWAKEPRSGVGGRIRRWLLIGSSRPAPALRIWLMPRVARELGSWQWAFLVLAIGPFSGAAAMLALRLLPDSLKMAGGRQ
jgi:hypothetical protein